MPAPATPLAPEWAVIPLLNQQHHDPGLQHRNRQKHCAGNQHKPRVIAITTVRLIVQIAAARLPAVGGNAGWLSNAVRIFGANWKICF